jgi:hypothetical protein
VEDREVTRTCDGCKYVGTVPLRLCAVVAVKNFEKYGRSGYGTGKEDKMIQK